MDILTNEEKSLLSQIACDNETGNHLFGGTRTKEYWEIRDELYVARHTMTPTERHVIMLEYVKQCADYDYYHSLPPEKRVL